MKMQRLAIAITIINFALLMLVLAGVRPTVAQDIVPVLRGRGLEIVDDQGRVRASIVVHPADPRVRLPNGKASADTSILRLIDPNGRPSVKLAASEQGSGLSLVGDSSSTYVVLKAEGAVSSLKLLNKDGREQLITP